MRNIKLKNLIYENKGYFDVLNKVLNSEDLAIGEAYKISVIAKALTEKMNTYMEVKKTLLDKYSAPDEEGNYNIADEKQQDFNKEYVELQNIEFELDGVSKIPFPESIKTGITPSDITVLADFFTFGDV